MHNYPLEDAQLPTLNSPESTSIDGLITVPSLSHPQFMHAHYLATEFGLLPSKRNFTAKTIDVGGAGPISAISTACDMINNQGCNTVAIVVGDAILSLPSKEFMARSNSSMNCNESTKPIIPFSYDLIAQWNISNNNVTREQLAMVSVLHSYLASKHPDAMCRKPITLGDVLKSPMIAPVTNLLECARRADGAASIIISSHKSYSNNTVKFIKKEQMERTVNIVGLGESSGPIKCPTSTDEITEDWFSCHKAVNLAYKSSGYTTKDIDFFGLYDCFPICLIQAIESVGLAPRGGGGLFIEKAYRELVETGNLLNYPINTHGGLLGFGAPWETPAIYNVIESVAQMRGEASNRQILPHPKTALVYGNGGIFSASSVAILNKE